MDAACVPVCKSCRERGTCEKPAAKSAFKPPNLRRRYWAPNTEMATLPCGCRQMPWPILRVFGENIEYVICDIHGRVKLTKILKRKEREKDAARREREQANTPLPEYPPY